MRNTVKVRQLTCASGKQRAELRCCGQGEIDWDVVQPECSFHKALQVPCWVAHMPAFQMVWGEFQYEFNIKPVETQPIEFEGCFSGGDRLFWGVCHDWPLNSAQGGDGGYRQVRRL